MFTEDVFVHPSVNHGQLLTFVQREYLQQQLQTNLRLEYRRRIEIMLLADQGHSQAQICEILQCSHETARYWIAMAQTGQVHLWKNLPIGRPKTINDEYLTRLKELVSQSPREFGYSFRCWTAQWLSKHLASELGIEVSDRHINRLLKKMGLSTRYKSTRNRKDKKSQNSNKGSGISIYDLSPDPQSEASKALTFPISLESELDF